MDDSILFCLFIFLYIVQSIMKNFRMLLIFVKQSVDVIKDISAFFLYFFNFEFWVVFVFVKRAINANYFFRIFNEMGVFLTWMIRAVFLKVNYIYYFFTSSFFSIDSSFDLSMIKLVRILSSEIFFAMQPSSGQ